MSAALGATVLALALGAGWTLTAPVGRLPAVAALSGLGTLGIAVTVARRAPAGLIAPLLSLIAADVVRLAQRQHLDLGAPLCAVALFAIAELALTALELPAGGAVEGSVLSRSAWRLGWVALGGGTTGALLLAVSAAGGIPPGLGTLFLALLAVLIVLGVLALLARRAVARSDA